MTNLKYITRSLILGISIILMSCTNDFESINTDTKKATSIDGKFLLPSAQSTLINHYINYDVNSNVMGVQAQHFSQYNYTDESNFVFRDGLLDSYIGNYYYVAGNLVKLQTAIDEKPEAILSTDKKNAWRLITATLKAFTIQHVTDANGPAMYSKAFDLKNKTPEYDSQQEIYETLLSELYTVVSTVKTETNLGLESQDIIYQGDLMKWKKFANSIMLRLAMRVSDVAPALSIEYTNKAVNENGGVFTSNVDNALYQYLSSPDANIYYESILDGWSPPIAPSSTIYDIQTKNKDPRKNMYWSATYWGDEGAVKYGEKGDFWSGSIINPQYVGNKTIGTYGKYYSIFYNGKQDAPGIFMDYAEVEFFLAEAALRGGYDLTGTAKEHYNNGVTASIEYNAELVSYEGDVASEIATYLAQDSIDFEKATDKMYRIGEEKWVALLFQGPEAWAEARRLDAPTMSLPKQKEMSDLPMRLVFPVREKILNGINVKEAASKLKSSDNFTTKLWWDTK
ncbi:MAG: hypothetical protein COB98_11355 [Flavobacteriaceae bacterium]|nr:MAG: hypothetical protein COB98_11355 [Flavobacteriaceae bacterium]